MAACAAQFSYVRYGLDLENEKLLHFEDPNKDLKLDKCARTDGKFHCVVLFDDEFFKLKADYERLVKQLAECQGR